VGPTVGLDATAKTNTLHVREANRRSVESSRITTDVITYPNYILLVRPGFFTFCCLL